VHEIARRFGPKLDYVAEILRKGETIEREQFSELREAKTEDEPSSTCRRRVATAHGKRGASRGAARRARPPSKRQPVPARTPA
jgi:hypothetical protein